MPCREKPKRPGPMNVKVNPYKKGDGTSVKGHTRHKPK